MDLEKENYINSVNLNIDTDFPYLVLDVEGDKACPRNPGFQVMHWHEDLQFIYVLDGISFRIKRYGLTFLQSLESVNLNRRIMYEYILSVVSVGDETIALFSVEPLNCTVAHEWYLLKK